MIGFYYYQTNLVSLIIIVEVLEITMVSKKIRASVKMFYITKELKFSFYYFNSWS